MRTPLRIAFFGSDLFSTLSLTRLHRMMTLTDKIEAIHVVTRSIKPTGRKLKQLIDSPVGIQAQKLTLPLHRIDKSDEFLALQAYGFNMAVAVSYGLFIPQYFLNGLQYGGINVHPSLLPKYSGAGPLQHALLNDDKFTGVTVQTLHPTKFDRGDILLQSGEIPIDLSDNYHTLEKKLGTLGADMLAETLEMGLYVDPCPLKSPYKYSYSPKVTASDGEVDWTSSSQLIKRRNDALGSVYSWQYVDTKRKKRELHRYKLSEIQVCSDTVGLEHPGDYKLHDGKLRIRTADGTIAVNKITQQYFSEEEAELFARRAGEGGRFLKKE